MNEASDLVEIDLTSIIGDMSEYEDEENKDIKEVLKDRMIKGAKKYFKKNMRTMKYDNSTEDFVKSLHEEAARVFEEELKGRVNVIRENMDMLATILSKISSISGSTIQNYGHTEIMWRPTISIHPLTMEEFKFLQECYRNPVSILQGIKNGHSDGDKETVT